MSGDATGIVILTEYPSLQVKQTINFHSHEIDCTSFSHSGGILAISVNAEIALRTPNLAQSLMTLTGHCSTVWGLSFSFDDKYLCSGGWDKLVFLYEVSTGHLFRTFSGHSDFITSLEFSPCGEYIASTGWDGSTLIFSVFSEKPTRSLYYLPYKVPSLDYSPRGTHLVTSYKTAIFLWKLCR